MKRFGEYIDTYVRKSALANTGMDDLPKEDLAERRERLLESWMMAGTAEELIERLAPFARMGVRHLMVWGTFGHMPDAMERDSLVRFMGDVVPALRGIEPDPKYLEQLIAESSDTSPAAPKAAAASTSA